jgi:hypothetical protein
MKTIGSLPFFSIPIFMSLPNIWLQSEIENQNSTTAKIYTSSGYAMLSESCLALIFWESKTIAPTISSGG